MSSVNILNATFERNWLLLEISWKLALLQASFVKKTFMQDFNMLFKKSSLHAFMQHYIQNLHADSTREKIEYLNSTEFNLSSL